VLYSSDGGADAPASAAFRASSRGLDAWAIAVLDQGFISSRDVFQEFHSRLPLFAFRKSKSYRVGLINKEHRDSVHPANRVPRSVDKRGGRKHSPPCSLLPLRL
jgi:hypothetical protein